MSRTRSVFHEDMMLLIRKNGYKGYHDYLTGKIDEPEIDILSRYINKVTSDKNLSQLLDIREKYMKGTKR